MVIYENFLKLYFQVYENKHYNNLNIVWLSMVLKLREEAILFRNSLIYSNWACEWDPHTELLCCHEEYIQKLLAYDHLTEKNDIAFYLLAYETFTVN